MPSVTKRCAFRRWKDGIHCPSCNNRQVIKRGKDDTQVHRQRYQCKNCGAHFDDLTSTINACHHQPLSVWIVCLYLMGLNLSNRQIAQELELDEGDVHQMTSQLRPGIVEGKPEVQLGGEVEGDQVYVTAGHKGNPDAVRKKGVKEGATARQKAVEYSSRFIAFSKGFGAEAPSKRKSLPIFGMIQRGGEVVIRMLANVQQTTIKPLIQTIIAAASLIYTDEYGIYSPLPEWGYEPKTVCHGNGEYARDEDGDGFCEVHVNTMEGFWSL